MGRALAAVHSEPVAYINILYENYEPSVQLRGANVTLTVGRGPETDRLYRLQHHVGSHQKKGEYSKPYH